MNLADLRANQEPDNMNKTSKVLAQVISEYIDDERPTMRDFNKNNNTIRKKNGVVTMVAANKNIITVTRDANKEIKFIFELNGALAVRLCTALKLYFWLPFAIDWQESRLVIEVDGEIKPINRGSYTATSLEMIANGET